MRESSSTSHQRWPSQVCVTCVWSKTQPMQINLNVQNTRPAQMSCAHKHTHVIATPYNSPWQTKIQCVFVFIPTLPTWFSHTIQLLSSSRSLGCLTSSSSELTLMSPSLLAPTHSCYQQLLIRVIKIQEVPWGSPAWKRKVYLYCQTLHCTRTLKRGLWMSSGVDYTVGVPSQILGSVFGISSGTLICLFSKALQNI